MAESPAALSAGDVWAASVIFVTVGNAEQPFARLLTKVDALAASGIFGTEPIFAQTGTYTGQLAYCQTKPFVSRPEFRDRLKESRLVISHGGAGTILEAIRLNKVPLVMPRRRKHGEIVNDHQVPFVRALAAEGLIVAAFEPDDLAGALRDSHRDSPRSGDVSSSDMLVLVERAIEELARTGRRGWLEILAFRKHA